MKQLKMSFFKNYKREFGGSLLVGKRKSTRPLSTKKPLHLVLRSEMTGVFNPGNRTLEKSIRNSAKKFNIHFYDMALNWNHIHLVIRLKDRNDYVKFIRAFTAELASHIRKIKPQLKAIFTLRPFTRILEWGKDFKNALTYQIINQLEARGLLNRKKQNQILKSMQDSQGKGRPKN